MPTSSSLSNWRNTYFYFVLYKILLTFAILSCTNVLSQWPLSLWSRDVCSIYMLSFRLFGSILCVFCSMEKNVYISSCSISVMATRRSTRKRKTVEYDDYLISPLVWVCILVGKKFFVLKNMWVAVVNGHAHCRVPARKLNNELCSLDIRHREVLLTWDETLRS